MRRAGPKKLCIDGTYGVNTTHFAVEEIDIFSNHFYPPNITILNSDIAEVESANRTYIAGEIAWTGLKGDSLSSFYNTILDRAGWGKTSNPVVVGSHFWSLFMHDVPDCSVSLLHTM